MMAYHNISRLLRRFFLLTCFAVFAGGNVQAQRYPFFNLKVENGLAQSQAAALAQDRQGNLWIGTLGGLSRYDGKTFTNYSVRNGMPSNMVNSIVFDSKGNLWAGGPAGIWKFNGKAFKTFSFARKDNQSLATEVHAGNNDTIWASVNGKLYIIVNEKIYPYKVPGSELYITAVLAEKNDLWLAKAGGPVYCRHQNRWDSLAMPMPPMYTRPPIVLKIFRDSRQTVWLTTNEGLYKITNGRIAVDSINKQPLYALPALYSITEDSSGGLWLGSNSGVLRIASNSMQYYNRHNGLSDNIFYSTLTDKEGNVWLASDGQGIFRFSGTEFTGLDESMGLPSGQVMAITADRAGRLYLGTYDAGIYIFENGQISPLAFPLHPTPAITALAITEGRLWIGTRSNGLWRYDKVFRSYTYPEHRFPSDIITCLYTDTSRRLWIGFANGAVVYDRDTFKRIPFYNDVSAFAEIGYDSIIIASGKGMKLYSGGAITDFKTGGAADSTDIECFTTRGNELWMGSDDNGVIAYNLKTGKTTVVNHSSGMQSDFIYNIMADNDGNIWAGTGYGIHKIHINDKGQPVVTFFGKAQGISGMESNHNAVFKMRDGSIWFGTTNGALHYLPHSKVAQAKPVSIVMQSVKLFGESITDTSYFDSTDKWYGVPQGLHLPFRKNNITFSFLAITLSGDQQMLYRYRIDGLDAPWSVWSPVNSVTFSALPPGKYTFRVQCTATPGGEMQELSYSFEIITPFYKTQWFSFALLMACILLGVTLQYAANSRKERRQRLMARLRAEEQAKIRVRTAEDFHDEVGNKLTRINVLTNVLRNKITTQNAEVARILNQIEENTNEVYDGTRDILWSLKPSNDYLYEILHRIGEFGNELFSDTDIEFFFTGIDERWKNYRLPLDVSRNLIMIFKEALNNCLKYSQAKHVKLEAGIKGKDALQMILIDDGTGFDLQHTKKGHGIDNMKIRTERIHGRLYIDSKKGKGTVISLGIRLPMPVKKTHHR